MILPVLAELLARVGRHPAVEHAVESLRRGDRDVCLAGATGTAKALVVAHLQCALNRPVVVLVDSNQSAELFSESVRFFHRVLSRSTDSSAAGHVSVLPAYDVLPYEGLSPHPEISQARATSLWRFVTGQAVILIAPVAAAMFRTRDADFYRSLACTLARDAEVSLDALLAHLSGVGYERQELVERPGQFAVRGGIVDVFSPEVQRPVRLELLGDTLESLREFDPDTQRTVAPVERATFLPLTDFPRRSDLLERISVAAVRRSFSPDADELRHAGIFPGWEFEAARVEPLTQTLADLSDRAVFVFDEPEVLEEQSRKLDTDLAGAFSRVAEVADVAPPETYYLSADAFRAALADRLSIRLERLAIEREAAPPLLLSTQPTTRYHGNVAAFLAEARNHLAANEDVVVSAASTGEVERLADLCREYEMPYQLGDTSAISSLSAEASGFENVSAQATLLLVKSPLVEGVVFPDSRLVLHGNADLFETLPRPERPRRRARTATFFSDFSDLRPGDFVVHVDHGIGQFEGLRQIETGGATGEFMLLRYAEDARLYVPLARLDLIQKYRTLGEAHPALDKLGGISWTARKTRVRKALADMADKLLCLYAERKTVSGHVFPPDSAWQKEFEDAFEFEETPDQARAIEDVKHDMERPLPMDRLLCGDVGYGKTEVAMRAAFKAINDSKQVAILAPTTVLAFQHFETFRRRLAAFPARVEMLSRFRSAREQKRILADLETGKVDVVIGTHRLLSRDVCFHDLGLLVVDEEQRFGVAHKERLKELRKNVDVLTMSATPIPRTLHMSLAGLRDMSLIETPPKDRLAIQTVVAPFRETLVQKAIEDELAREGQVYFVHNRVQSIHSLASLVQRLVPRARLVVSHGQMAEKELERVMLRFIRHEADVLVSTSIIENGLDIPRVNTILINRADRFGLSELYQLRGRVGRSNQRAYAYLLVPQERGLTALARRRLAALTEFSELGAGFRIAALDLELRGAGNLLGRQQHGHINAIGFDLYCQMLERAVSELKGEAAAPELRVTLNLGLDIRIPSEYVPSENLRLRTYKRIAGVTTEPEHEELLRELEDRFGPPPQAVRNLLDYAVLKAVCERLLVASVERRGARVGIKFHDHTPVRPENVVRLLRRSGGRGLGLRLDPSGVLWMDWVPQGGAAGVIASVQKVLLQLQT